LLPPLPLLPDFAKTTPEHSEKISTVPVTIPITTRVSRSIAIALALALAITPATNSPEEQRGAHLYVRPPRSFTINVTKTITIATCSAIALAITPATKTPEEQRGARLYARRRRSCLPDGFAGGGGIPKGIVATLRFPAAVHARSLHLVLL
jgi:hypothetical protein